MYPALVLRLLSAQEEHRCAQSGPMPNAAGARGLEDSPMAEGVAVSHRTEGSEVTTSGIRDRR